MKDQTEFQKYVIIMWFLLFCAPALQAQQSVGIGTDTPNPNAILDLVTDGSQGLLLPRMTTLERTNSTLTSILTNADNGLTVFDVTDGRIYFWFNGSWITSTVTLQAGAGIDLTGNTIVNTGDLDPTNEAITGAFLTGTLLTLEENNLTVASIDLSSLQDGIGTDNQTAAQVNITSNTNLVSSNVQDALEELQNEIIADGDASVNNETITNVSLAGASLIIEENNTETGRVDLSSLQDGTGTDDQVATEVAVVSNTDLISTNVQAALEELQSEIIADGDASATNETITNISLTGTSLTIEENNVQTGSVDLSSLQDGTGTDNQTATQVNITSTTDLAATNVQSALEELQNEIIADGDGSTTNETITNISLIGTSLTIEENNVQTGSVDLSSLQDGTGTDNQTATQVNITSTTDLVATNVQTALEELQGEILADVDGSTTNEAISDVTLSGTSLIIEENGIQVGNVDFSPILPPGGTDDQTATEVLVTSDMNLTATNVQTALVELQNEILADNDTDALNEAISSVTFLGNILEIQENGATVGNVDLSSLQDGIGTDDQTATEVNITSTTDLAATNVQSALEELQSEILTNSNVTSTAIVDGEITNIDIATSAAIDGTKVDPDFGIQDIVTTGNMSATTFTGNGSGLTNVPVGVGSVATISIADNAVTSIKIAANTITAADIATNGVGAAEIAANAVGSSEIGTGAVGSEEILDGEITNIDIATGAAIDGTKVDPDFGIQDIVTTGNMSATTFTGNGSGLTNVPVGVGSVATTSIADNAVTSIKIAANTITAADIATNGVGAAEIAANAVGSSEIGTGAVGSEEILDGEITNIDIATGAAIDGTKVDPDFGIQDIVTTGNMSATTFTGNGSGLTNVPVGVGSVATTSIADNAVTSIKIAANTITAADIATNGVGAAEIAANAVGASEIGADAVGTSEIDDGAIATADIADNAITSIKIAANTITAADIATNGVGAAEISANAVGASEIAADAVGTSEIDDGSITNADISTSAANRIAGSKITPNFGNQNASASSFNFNTAKQRVQAYHPVDFQALRVGTSNASLRAFDVGNFQVHFAGGESNVAGFATVPVRLPDGATIQGLEATVFDNITSSEGFARVRVVRAPYGNTKSTGFEDILLVETTPAFSNNNTQDLSSGAIVTSGADVIDNASYSYFIIYRADSNTNQVQLHGVRITYSVSSLD